MRVSMKMAANILAFNIIKSLVVEYVEYVHAPIRKPTMQRETR